MFSVRGGVVGVVRVFPVVMLLFFFGCGGGSDSAPPPQTNNPPTDITGQAALGPLVGATVTVYDQADFLTPLYTTTTSNGSDWDTAGWFTIPGSVIQDDVLYVITATGGMDIDADDDGVIDASPTTNNGTLHLAATGVQLRAGSPRVTVLSELAYEAAAYLMMIEAPVADILAALPIYARQLLKADITGDGMITYDDLLSFSPKTDRDAVAIGIAMNSWVNSRIHNNESIAIFSASQGRSGYLGQANIGGLANGMAAANGYAYIAAGTDGVRVVDFRDRDNPVFGTTVSTGGEAMRLTISGSYLYVAAGSAGLAVLDIRDPALPVVSGSVATTGAAVDLDVVGSRAYVACGTDGLSIVDVAAPASPSFQGSVDTSGTATGVAVLGDVVYVADGAQGLQVIDASNPAVPTVVRAVTVLGAVNDVAVAGGYAYLVGEAFSVADLATPADPQIVSALDSTVDMLRVAVGSDHAVVAGYAGPMPINTYLSQYNVRIPSAPSLVQTLSDPGFGVQPTLDIAIDDQTLIFSAWHFSTNGKLTLYHFADEWPASWDIARLPLSGSGWGRMAVTGDHLLVSDWSGVLTSVDIADPTGPSVSDTLAITSGSGDITVEGTVASVGAHPDWHGLVDVQDPFNLSIHSQLNLPTTFPYGQSIGTSRIYNDHLLIMRESGAQVYDISNPTVPVNRGLQLLDILPGGLSTSGALLYVGAGNCFTATPKKEFAIYDMTDPTSLQYIGGLDLSEGGCGVAVRGDFAYLVNDYNIEQIDISTIGTPTSASSSEFTKIYGFHSDGNYIYTGPLFSAILLQDIRDPSTSVLKGYVPISSPATDMIVVGDFLYVYTRTEGLLVYPKPVRAVP